jgi:hypothetical protein
VDALIDGYGQGGGGVVEGILLSGFSGPYMLPTVADLRNIPSISVNDMFISSDTRFASMFVNNNTNANGGFYTLLEEVYLPEMYGFSSNMFKFCGKLKNIYGDFSRIALVGNSAFWGCKSLTDIPYMPNLTTIGAQSFNGCTGLTRVRIYSTLTSCQANAFVGCTNITDFYVPWAEGAVANSPWGATNAKIHYNTTYDENGEPIV